MLIDIHVHVQWNTPRWTSTGPESVLIIGCPYTTHRDVESIEHWESTCTVHRGVVLYDWSLHVQYTEGSYCTIGVYMYSTLRGRTVQATLTVKAK